MEIANLNNRKQHTTTKTYHQERDKFAEWKGEIAQRCGNGVRRVSLAHKSITQLARYHEVVHLATPRPNHTKTKKGQPFDYPSWRCVGDSNP